MRPDILIVGQGLAGTLLAWECERAGLAFEIADPGHEHAASRVAAGIINPVTGQRLVKSWRIDSWLPVAREAYRGLESALGVPLWRDMRVRRLFANERERKALAAKQASGELAPYVTGPAAESSPASDGFWIEGAARVNLPELLVAARARWKAQGRLREEGVNALQELAAYAVVIDCMGVTAAAGLRSDAFAFVPWEFSKGELLVLDVAGLDPEVILNRGQWVVPVGEGRALVGATHQPGIRDEAPTAAARAELEASARAMLPQPEYSWRVVDHLAGVRVNLPDKRPVAGRHPHSPKLGLINGLGAKGVLYAPALARMWAGHLARGTAPESAFDPEVDVRRFPGRRSSQVSSL